MPPITPVPTDVIGTIKGSYVTLRPSYRKIADYLISHNQDAAFMPASRLAAEVGVSETMVVRFASEMGYGSYSGLAKEIQNYVKQSLIPSNRLRQTAATEALEPVALRSLVLAQDAINLQVTSTDYVNRSFGTVVQHLAVANRIFILGLRGMAHLALLLGYLLEDASADTTVMIRGDSQIFSNLRHMKQGDALVAFAYSRYSRRALDAIHYARGRGVVVLTVTDRLNSPPAVLSDVVLRAAVSSRSFMASHASGVAMIYALAEAYSLATPNRPGFCGLMDILPPNEILPEEDEI